MNRTFKHIKDPIEIGYEPKFQNRFVIEFNKPFNEIKSYTVTEASRPKFINSEWAPMEIKFVDPIGPSTSKAIMSGLEQYKKDSIISYNIKLLDPVGQSIEQWDIKGKLQEICFGDMKYGSNDILEIKMIINVISVKLI